MQELESILGYLKDRPLVLQAGGLNSKDRIVFYVIHNRILNAITRDNPAYKTMAELLHESAISISEMHDDIIRLSNRGYGKVAIIDNFKFSDALEELARVDLQEHQNCVSYLSDLAVSSLAVIQCNEDLSQEQLLVFETIIYISLIALNLFNAVHEDEPALEGVGISFDRKRRDKPQSK